MPDARVILALWADFGVVSLCGALALAELSSMLPRTGGAYALVHAAYGEAAAFAFGWLYLLVTTPAAIGALATFFAELCTPGYPSVPAVFLVGTSIGLAAIVWGEIAQSTPNYSPVWGLLIAAAGFPPRPCGGARARPDPSEYEVGGADRPT